MVIEVNGIEMHCDIHGEGEPLLWLHGFLGCGADWLHIFGTCPDGYQLIAPDLRGHGRTTNPSGTYSHAQCARDVLALLDRLALPRVKAIGVSGGGIVLFHLATMDPSRVEAMVAVSAPPYFPPEARAFQRQFSPAVLGSAEADAMRLRHPRDGQFDALVALARGFADSYDDVNFTPPLLSTIAAETLIVFGDRDPLYPVSLACGLRRAIPRSHLWVIPGGGHAPVFGAARGEFAAVAIAFLGGGGGAQPSDG